MPGDPGSDPDRSYRLAIHLDGILRRVVPLDAAGLVVGREKDSGLVLEDPRVSRKHCRIFLQHGRPWVEDTASSSGTYVNQEKTGRSVLGPGDEVRVGPFVLVVESGRPGPAGTEPAGPETTAAGVGSRELDSLLALLESLDVRAPREEVLHRILDALLRLLDGERAFLYRQQGRRKAVERIFSHMRPDADPSMPVSETLVLEVATTREPCLRTDLVDLEGGGEGSLARLADASVQSIVISPLIQGRRLAGILYVDSRGSRRNFTLSDLDHLARATRYLAGIVDGIESREELSRENSRLRAIVRGQGGPGAPLEELCDPASSFRPVLAHVKKAAQSDVSILITGETGTGKEETARLLHRLSPRERGPFMAINCGAIPENLVESELFGYMKGAFSGAAEDRAGLIELSDGGTLFLDEVGELPLPVQVKLLRVLEERAVQRIGSGAVTAVDFRLLAATHRNLSAAVTAGTFRQDLLYRLKVFHIELPPLRDRLMDLPLLVRYLMEKLAPRTGKSIQEIEPDALEVLAGYEWPGNIRELRNVLERAMVLEESTALSVGSLPVEIVQAAKSRAAPGSPEEPVEPGGAADPHPAIRAYGDELRDFERDYFRRLRQIAGTNISAMARIAKVTRLTLYRKLGQIGLEED